MKVILELLLENEAKALLDEYFAENKPAFAHIRIGLKNACGAVGNTLCLRPDKETVHDSRLQAGGYNFVMDKDLAAQVGRWLRIGAKEHGGFQISSELPLDAIACEVNGRKLQTRPQGCML